MVAKGADIAQNGAPLAARKAEKRAATVFLRFAHRCLLVPEVSSQEARPVDLRPPDAAVGNDALYEEVRLLAGADEPIWWRALLFAVILARTGGITLYRVVKSKVLADFFDALSDERVSWSDKWRVLARRRRP